MGNKDKNIIVVLADKYYVDQVKQVFSSVYYNSGWKGDYMIMTSDMDDQSLHEFKEKGILIYKYNDEIYKQITQNKDNWITVFGKFELFKEFFKQWDKIIFLDGDIIVKSSLDELLKLDGFNAPNAPSALLNEIIRNNYIKLKGEFRNTDYKLYDKLNNNYDLNEIPFNPGIMVIETNIIKHNTYQDIISLYKEYGILNKFREESTLNLYFYKKRKNISSMYNTLPVLNQISYKIKIEEMKVPILHFMGYVKPWHAKTSKYYNEWKDNLNKFEYIDLNNRPKAITNITLQDIKNYKDYLNKNKINNKLIIIWRYFILKYLPDKKNIYIKKLKNLL